MATMVVRQLAMLAFRTFRKLSGGSGREEPLRRSGPHSTGA